MGDYGPESVQKYGEIEDWDTSEIRDMQGAFWNYRTFNRDISRWNTSRVTNMAAMFQAAMYFNAPIGRWDVGRVKDMEAMFEGGLRVQPAFGEMEHLAGDEHERHVL